jgi:cytochrome b involved in lipid metabolism
MDEHPGGTDILRLHAGEDATREFDDVGHSSTALKQLKSLVVGILKK